MSRRRNVFERTPYRVVSVLIVLAGATIATGTVLASLRGPTEAIAPTRSPVEETRALTRSVQPPVAPAYTSPTTSAATRSAGPTAVLTPASGPTATPLSDPTGTPAVPPAAYVSYFGTLPPGAPLPGEAACAREVARDPWEPRPDNRVANQTNPFTQGFRLRDSYLGSYGPGYEDRVTGNFTGTTDEIIRWGACKWGFDENTVRAQAVVESFWRQSTRGDCGVRAQPGMNGCDTSS